MLVRSMKRSEVDRSKLSPMMQQYMEIKDKYEDCIIFFRLGDFYEMFFDDAILTSRILELTLTGNIIFQITPLKDDNIEIINLSKKNTDDSTNKYIVNAFDKKTITIGRHIDCDFSFPKNKSFSRFQTTMEFDEELKKWTIIDGNKNKSSTNGTWIFGTHSFLIRDEMIVEILNCQIRIIEVKSDCQ